MPSTLMRPERLGLDRLPTPVGDALIAFDEDGVVRAFDFADHEARMHRLLKRHYGDLPLVDDRLSAATRGAIQAYFSGDLRSLSQVRWATGGTDFQRRVWKALTAIPVGQTLSYGQLAARVGAPRAVRAVGLANSANPVGVIVPCHRVIGANGALTGYAGGLERKRWLLAHESAMRLA